MFATPTPLGPPASYAPFNFLDNTRRVILLFLSDELPPRCPSIPYRLIPSHSPFSQPSPLFSNSRATRRLYHKRKRQEETSVCRHKLDNSQISADYSVTLDVFRKDWTPDFEKEEDALRCRYSLSVHIVAKALIRLSRCFVLSAEF